MSKGYDGVDKIFLSLIISLLIIGFAVFLSASMGIFAKDSAQFTSIAFKQGFFGIVLGLVTCFIFSKINYKFFKKYSLSIFILSLLACAAIFIPNVGVVLNGAKRWIIIFGLSFQPVALLNIGFIMYWAAWLSSVKEKVAEIKYGLVPLLVILTIIGVLLLKQPDTDSFFIICATGIAMFLIAGGRFKHVLLLGLVGIVCLAVLAFSRPYVMSRIETFINPSANSLTSGYQLQQSLIAIGSGQFSGRGFGQSVQKYKFLPESISDSIFAVLGEEIGFVGCIIIIALFLAFIFRGFRIAIKSPDIFGGLLVMGIVILISLQSFVNIASTLGIIPFSGVPLAFFSQGGTSMLAMLAQMGIVLNVSRFGKI
jgi:cell division protein FtsW